MYTRISISHMYIRIYVQMYMRIHTYTYVHLYVYTYVHSYVHEHAVYTYRVAKTHRRVAKTHRTIQSVWIYVYACQSLWPYVCTCVRGFKECRYTMCMSISISTLIENTFGPEPGSLRSSDRMQLVEH